MVKPTPAPSAGAISTGPRFWTLHWSFVIITANVTAMASAMPDMPMMLPLRAVAGDLSPLMPKMKRTVATR